MLIDEGVLLNKTCIYIAMHWDHPLNIYCHAFNVPNELFDGEELVDSILMISTKRSKLRRNIMKFIIVLRW